MINCDACKAPGAISLLDSLYEVINSVSVDLVLCMTVNPGFGGQSFLYDVLKKVEVLAKHRDNTSNNFMIEVDGGVGFEHIQPCLNAGVDIFVAGTAYYKGSDSERREFAQGTPRPSLCFAAHRSV